MTIVKKPPRDGNQLETGNCNSTQRFGSTTHISGVLGDVPEHA
jgi:hypothetical protein